MSPETEWTLGLAKIEKKVVVKKDEDDPETKWKYELKDALGRVKIVFTVEEKLPWPADAELEVRVRSPYTQATLVDKEEA